MKPNGKPPETVLDELHEELNKLENEIFGVIKQRNSFLEGMQHLEVQAERINTLASQMASEIIRFRDLAIEVNSRYQTLQHCPQTNRMSLAVTSPTSELFPVWEIDSAALPTLVKRDFSFVLSFVSLEVFNNSEQTIQDSNN